MMYLRALDMLGEWEEASRLGRPLLQEARRLGQRNSETAFASRMSVILLRDDDPEGARELLTRVWKPSLRLGFTVQHYHLLLGLVQTELYRGDGPAAWATLQAQWPSLVSALVMRAQYIRLDALHLRARAALAAAAAGQDPPAMSRIAEDMARRIARAGAPWAAPLAPLIRAQIALLTGRPGAAELLEHAAGGLDAAAMKMYAAAARRRLAEIRGGETGDWMLSQKVKCPERVTRMLAPVSG